MRDEPRADRHGTFRRPQIPLLSCTTGGVVERFNADHLWRAMRHRFDVRPVLDCL
ncbi:hypothetical protein [Streptomyces sp. YGL11-2]|uniref:hypothetical protein n=1 Tax=Streptomyces sp. YGL11-2 TaxID=3414028 RepID=UPI003CEAFB31